MVVVTLLSKTYEINCPESEAELLQESAVKLNELLQENKQKFPHLTAFQLMLLGALTSSHELLKCERLIKEERKRVAEAVGLLDKKRP